MAQLLAQLFNCFGAFQTTCVNSLTTSAVTVCLIIIQNVGATCTQTPKSYASERPNVLLIAIDDLRPALGCYRDPLAKSPQIDQFAKSARRFDRAYVQQAVCGPSRTSLLTGLLPDHTRVWHNRNRFRETRPDHVTLPQLFKQNGYRSLGLGKIFSGNQAELDPISWSEPETLKRKGWRNYVLPQNQGKEKKQAAFEAADVPDDFYPDGKLANLALKTLESLEQENTPFFLAVGFFKPHLPFNAPKKYWDLYDRTAFELPAASSEPVSLSPDIALHSHRELGGYKGVPKNENLNAAQTQLLRHGYYACVSYIDAQVGKLLAALKRLELDQNTIIVIWGDHGFALGETNRWCKATNFELDTRVPLLIRTPDLVHPGVGTESLVEMVDLYPTLAAVAELEVPMELDGRSFLPLLNDPHATTRAVLLTHFNRPWTSTTPATMGYSIRTKNARYTRWLNWKSGQTIAEELYDYSELQNVTLQSGHLIERRNTAAIQPALLKRMSHRMDGLLASRRNKASE
ncbi:MAG: sulfatase [Planctomycetota bacterium]|nr:sulfatase [Planctomycetota bacterium]